MTAAARAPIAIPVSPRRLPARTVATYTSGQCVALAIALHERTGWPIVALATVDMYAVDKTGPADPVTGILPGVHPLDLADSFVHAGVLAPDGRVLDVAGFHGLRELVVSWSEEEDVEFLERDGSDEEADRSCGPDCVCPDWCLEDADLRVTVTTAGALLEARKAGGWPVPRMAAAEAVADRLLGVGPTRSR